MDHSPTSPLILPLACTWGVLVELLAAERGGLAELSRHLQDVAPQRAKVPTDPTTVERGLRRLKQRGHGEGNKYGKLLLRYCGLPLSLQRWAREMGQYHSRCSDLSVELRQDQLRLWDCPPVSESAEAIWIHLGLASLAHRKRDLEHRDQRLECAEGFWPSASVWGKIELLLFRAWVWFESERPAEARSALDEAMELWRHSQAVEQEHDEGANYFARIQDQWAYIHSRTWRTEPEVLEGALGEYEAIPEHSAPPFAAFRRSHGRAWCLWRMGRSDEALAASRHASQAAGDGGLLRFRAMALGLQAHILGLPGHGAAPLQRAKDIAQRLHDRRLMARLSSFDHQNPR